MKSHDMIAVVDTDVASVTQDKGHIYTLVTIKGRAAMVSPIEVRLLFPNDPKAMAVFIDSLTKAQEYAQETEAK